MRRTPLNQCLWGGDGGGGGGEWARNEEGGKGGPRGASFRLSAYGSIDKTHQTLRQS